MKILNESSYRDINKKYRHLLEVSIPPTKMIEKNLEWKVRDGFPNGGTLMVGDLRVLKDKTSVLEIHPFPEWVVQIFQYGIETGDTFAIVPNFPKKEVDDMRDLPWSLRVEKIEALLNDLELSEYLAVKYQDGVCLKVPANIPHEFIRIADKNENVPYCQVFEPDFKSIGEVFQIQPTMFFEIMETLSITH